MGTSARDEFRTTWISLDAETVGTSDRLLGVLVNLDDIQRQQPRRTINFFKSAHRKKWKVSSFFKELGKQTPSTFRK